MADLNVVILAAGKGTRMKSDKPKVLHTLGGLPMLQRVINTAEKLNPSMVVVVTGFGAQQVQQTVFCNNLQFVMQEQQLGTGHAVLQALPLLPQEGITLILSGDVPLVQAQDLAALTDACAGKVLAVMTVEVGDPFGYGRIVRDAQQHISGIVEQRDATAEQQKICEVNTGIMAVPTAALRRWLPELKCENAQNEYYLTDIVSKAVKEELSVVAHKVKSPMQVAGVNSPMQLATLEREYQNTLAHDLMKQGVRLADPARLDIRGNLQCAQDVEIDVNCVFYGDVILGPRVRIGPHCVIANVKIDADVCIEAFTHIDGQGVGVEVGSGVHIGPYARLRPGVKLERDVHVGNFVEIKNSKLAQGSKANHLSYVGDATIGSQVNIGAGTITANYDGVNKYPTVIGDETRIGSNSVLVAPVTIGARGTIGAGSVVTRDTPENSLTLTRAEQKSIVGWKRPEKSGRGKTQ